MENKNIDLNSLSSSDFEFVQNKGKIHDQKFETKKVGYFKDAMMRFGQNKGSVVAFIILLLLTLFSIITPFVSGYESNQKDSYYTLCLPKNPLFENTSIWNGLKSERINSKAFALYESYGAIRSYEEEVDSDGTTFYNVQRDTYVVGCIFKTFTKSEFEELSKYDQSLSLEDKIIQPLVDTSWIDTSTNNGYVLYNLFLQNANYCYKMTYRQEPLWAADPETGDDILDYCYKTDENGNYVFYSVSGTAYTVRLNYDNYYKYVNGSSPYFILGSDVSGRDIMTRLAVGGRLSLSLGLIVSFFNITIGVIYGAIEGYYGGATDMIMERITEILNDVPFMIVVTLFSLYLADKVGPIVSLFFAFVMTGWIGTASTVRMQFYRYKGQEYVLAARTLGARDSRIIFRHILPNAIGPIVTSSVLMIPSVIFSESSLSYLKIIDLTTSSMTSIGTMLSEGQDSFTTNPNLVIWPAIFISLLMICFNIFGNGLRDAFNPQLRGS